MLQVTYDDGDADDGCGDYDSGDGAGGDDVNGWSPVKQCVQIQGVATTVIILPLHTGRSKRLSHKLLKQAQVTGGHLHVDEITLHTLLFGLTTQVAEGVAPSSAAHGWAHGRGS